MKNNASLARANKNIRRRKLCGKAVTVFLLVALSVVFLVPFAWMLLTSLKSMEEVYQRTIFPTKLHFDNYILAVTQIPFLRYAWNTTVITALCVVGTVISSAMVAYSMSKVRWNGKKYLFPIIVATMMIPYQVTLIPLYMIWNKLGLIGSIAPLVVPAFFGGAYYIFLLRQFLRASRIPCWKPRRSTAPERCAFLHRSCCLCANLQWQVSLFSLSSTHGPILWVLCCI